jgi:hypothetical protein
MPVKTTYRAPVSTPIEEIRVRSDNTGSDNHFIVKQPTCSGKRGQLYLCFVQGAALHMDAATARRFAEELHEFAEQVDAAEAAR